MTETACPTCGGLSQLDHPAGALGGWRHVESCLVLWAEDATASADHDRLEGRSRFDRTATDAERLLLAAIGYTGTQAEDLVTEVYGITPGVRLRTWPRAHPPTTDEG
jgi:hypothetical protein